METNSIANQNIKKSFVNQNVFNCVTTIVEFILQESSTNIDAPFNYSEMERFYYQDGEGKVYTERQRDQQIKDWAQELTSITADPASLVRKSELEYLIADLELAHSTAIEICDWWMVSDHLAEFLRKYDEAVITDDMQNCYWGRTEAGQPIMADRVITKICLELEILQGQQNERVI